jgi:hypothetical protein
MLRGAPNLVAAATAVGVSLLAAELPWNTGLVLAGLAGMVAGAGAELAREARA